MPTLAELRSQLPELQGLTDDQAVDAVQQAFYPDFSRDEIARDLGVKIAPPPPPPTPERTLGGGLKDIGVAAMRGGVGAVESVVGLGNLVSGGQVGKAVEDFGVDLKGAKEYWGEGFSDAQKEANRRVNEAEGLWEVVKAAVKNPSVAGLSLVESLPQMMIGGLFARGMVAGATALSPRLAAQMATARAAPFVASVGARANTAAIPVVAGALGEGVVGAGSAAEQIRQQSGTGTLTGDQAPLALATGAANAAFGMIGGKVAQSMGLKDIDTLLAGAASNPRAAKGVVRRVLEGFVSEGALEELPQSISEQVMQNMALDRPLDEGVNQAAVLGLMAGGIMGAGANVMSGSDAARPGPKDILAAPDVDTAIKTAEQAIPKPATPAAAPVGDTLTGSSMADLLQRQIDPLSRAAQDQRTLTGATPADLLTGQPTDPIQAPAREGAIAREDQRQDDLAGSAVDTMRREVDSELQGLRQWDARRQPDLPELDMAIQPGDVLQKNGAPWPEAGAKLHLKAVLKGQGEIVPVAGGGYIVRPKKKEQPDEKITGIAGGAGVNQAVAQGNAAAPEPVPAGLPGAELENGFRQGPAAGERYRVSDISATGGLMLEKRLPAGTVAGFYVGKDGGLVDADGVNLIGDGVELLWKPENDQDRQEARDILQEMGALALTDPKRAALKARLKALVTKAPDAKSPAAAPAPAAPAPVPAPVGPAEAGQPQADRAVGAPGDQPAADAKPALTEAGDRWTRMTAAERSAVLDRTAAKDKAKARIVNQSWDDLADGWRRAIARSMGELQAAAPTVSRETPPASQEVSGVSERAQTGNTSVRELALQEQRDAGWNTDWPFIPADLLAADFRDLIRNDPSMDAAEKERIMSAGKKLGVVPANETQPRDPESGQFVAEEVAPPTGPKGALQEARDNNPVVQFGRAMRDAGMELSGNDVRDWSADIGKRGEIHALMAGRPPQPYTYTVRRLLDGAEVETLTTVNLSDAAMAVRDMRTAGNQDEAKADKPVRGFDPVKFDNDRAERVKASREAGYTHLDKLPAYVETMRGQAIEYVHDTKVRGVVRTVDNRGNVYVNWSDAYSAEKEMASPVQEGRKSVMQSSLGPRDLKDYRLQQKVAAPQASEPVAAAPAVPEAAPEVSGEAPAAAPAEPDRYPFGKTDKEDQFFGSRVRVTPDLKGDTAWEGTVTTVLNGGRLVSVRRDGQDAGSVRISGERITVLERKDSEEAAKVPLEIRTLPLDERWEALVERTKNDGGDPDKGQRSYRAFTSLVTGSTGDKPMDVWGRWSSGLGSTDLVNRTGAQVLKWMEENLPTRLDGYASSLPGNSVSGTGTVEFWRKTAAEMERRKPQHDQYMARLEGQANDVEELAGNEERIADARKAIGEANRAWTRNERSVQDGLARAEKAETEERQRIESEELAAHKPFDAKALSAKPTPASMSGWFSGQHEGRTVWTNGHILDLTGEPHLKGWENRIDTLGRNKDGKLDIGRVIPKDAKTDAVPFGWRDKSYGSDFRHGVVFFDIDGTLGAIDALYVRYFLSKYKGATFKADASGSAFTVQHEGKTVGVVMPINLTKYGDEKPTVDSIKAKVRARPSAAPSAESAPDTPQDDDVLPAISEAQARKQMEWRNLGQKDGVKTHALFFYERPEDKGTGQSMGQGKVTRFDGASGWQVEGGDGTTYPELSAAKRAAEDAAIPNLQRNGFVVKDTSQDTSIPSTDGADVSNDPPGIDTYPLAPAGTRYTETDIEPTMMSPDEFLSRVRPLEIDEASRDNIDDLKQMMRDGRPLDPLHLYADGKEDGRHRAHAARELGIRQVPVIVYQKADEAGATADAGAELTYNRRNRIRTGMKWSDYEKLDPALRVREATKEKVRPRPDYQGLVDGGMNPLVAHIVKQAYDALASKPQTRAAPTDADIQAYIDALNQYMDGVLAWANDPLAVAAWLTRIGRQASAYSSAASGLRTSLSDMAGSKVEGVPTLLETVYPGGWRKHEKAVRAAGGNKALSALQPSTDEAIKAMKDIDKGWPGKIEPWQRQGYKVVPGAGVTAGIYEGQSQRGAYAYGHVTMAAGRGTRTIESKLFEGDGKAAEAQAWADARAAELQDQQLLLTKSGTLHSAHPDAEAARAQARELTKRDTGGGTVIDDRGTSVVQAERTGVARRQDGQDISSDQLMAAFGFKGVNFGTWMKGKGNEAERQLHLNHAYDAFMDLSDILGVPPKAMSLNGMLGLAIGAQGGGKASAHFVPGVNEINLTRTAGAGALAHEWGHAVDHYFARLAGFEREKDPFLTEKVGRPDTSRRMEVDPATGKYTNREVSNWTGELRPEVRDAFRAIVQAMNKKQETPAAAELRMKASAKQAKDRFDKWAAAIRRDFDGKVPAGTLDELLGLLGNGETGNYVDKTFTRNVSLLREAHKKATGRTYSVDNLKGLQMAAQHVRYVKDRADGNEVHEPQMVSTEYATNAAKLDGETKRTYWSTNLEKFARAFDAWVHSKLAERDAKNSYLAGLNVGDARVSPVGEELASINAAFDKLVQTIDTRETDDGVAMFQQGEVGGEISAEVQDRMIAAYNANITERLPDGYYYREVGRDEMEMMFGDLEDMPAEVRAALERGEPVIDAGTPNDSFQWAKSEAPTEADFIRDNVRQEEMGPVKVNSIDAMFNENMDESGASDAFKVLAESEGWDAPDRGTRYFEIDKPNDNPKSKEDYPYIRIGVRISDHSRTARGSRPNNAIDININMAPQQGRGNEFHGADDWASAVRKLRTARLDDDGELKFGERDASKFSQSAPAKGERRSAAMLQYEADAITDLWRRKPTVIAVDSWRSNGVPAAVRREAEERISRGGAAPRAVFADGRVYLFAEALDSKTMPESLYHEVLGHYGMWGHFGEELDRELEMVATLRQADMRRIFEQTGMDPNNAANRIRAAEEVVAYLAQTRPNLSVVQRIVAAIRNWLRANVPGFKDMELSDADIIQKYILPARQYVEGGGPRGPGGKTTMEPAFQGGDANRPFYSALARGIEGLTAKALPVEGWRGAVNNLVNTGKAKADEIEWSGLREWLEMQTGKVSKDEVLNYLQANGVQVQEVVLGAQSNAEADKAMEKWGIVVSRNPEDENQVAFLDRDNPDDLMTADELESAGYPIAAVRAAMEIESGGVAVGATGFPKHGQWVLPGGQNYREVLLTLPRKEKTLTEIEKELGYETGKLTNAQQDEVLKLWKQHTNKSADYSSSHWDTPNVLAHIRLNDRTDADGNRVLFVEEIQSDWGQQGKKGGFGKVTRYEYEALQDNGQLVRSFREKSEAEAFAKDRGLQLKEIPFTVDTGTPTAPFVTSTDKWLSLALKRVITMAAQEGYDKVAFVTGEQSAERYDLSKQVKRVVWSEKTGTLAAERADSAGARDDRPAIRQEGVTADKLADLIGKDAAQRLIDAEEIGGWRAIEGDSLKIGGEGMRAFYDKIVPAAANKLLAKLGGGKMSPVSMGYESNGVRAAGEVRAQQSPGGGWILVDADGERANMVRYDSREEAEREARNSKSNRINLQQPGFNITPAMREKATGGLPLFQQRHTTDQTETPEFKAWFGDSKVVDAEGKPLVVYHGTATPGFSAFDPAQARSEGGAFFFSHSSLMKNPATNANGYATRRGGAVDDGAVMPVYLRMQNPLIAGFAEPMPEGDEAIGQWLDRMYKFNRKLDADKNGYYQRTIKEARRNGHDGVIFKNVEDERMDGGRRWNDETDVYAAFRPEQIKSATGNRGTFDPTSPNIMFQQAIDDGALNQPRDFFQMGKDVVREKAAGGLPLFQQRRADQTETPEFRAWFKDSKVVDDEGRPLVVYHGTHSDVTSFKPSDGGMYGTGIYVTPDEKLANVYATDSRHAANEGASVYPLYVSAKNLASVSEFETAQKVVAVRRAAREEESRANNPPPAGEFEALFFKPPEVVQKPFGQEVVEELEARGFDGIFGDDSEIVVFHPEQIKSATGNRGTFDPASPNIMFQQAIDDGALNQPRDFFQMGKDVVREIGATPGKLHWWHKSVGTQYNLARKNPMYRRVFERVQDFLNDVSLYATEAADAAPNIMPKLESWRDILKTAMPAADAKAIQAPIFEGTLTWARDADGQPVKVMDLEEAAKAMTTQDKAQEMLRRNLVDPKVLRMWQGLPIDQYEQAVNTRYQNAALRPGIVWTGAELKRMFKLDDNQIGLYREALASVKESITRLALSDMVRYAGDDVGAVREEVMGAKDILAGAETLRDQLLQLRDEQPERADVLEKTANKVMDKAERAQKLIAEGYFPLMRFGHYTVTVRGEDGAVKFFSMYENRFEAQRAAQKLSQDLPEGDYVTRGTMNEEAYKLFAGVTPETLELFGEMLGLEGDGTSAADKVFQSYLKLARDNRSSMKRLIHRKGTAGFSDDVGRVLAGFVYSNARQISRNLHQGEIDRAVRDINDPEAGGDKDAGELGQQASRLAEYIKNPVEEAQALRGLLFAQYLGGSIASAVVNMTQPFAVTMPWLSQYGGMKKAGAQMASALKVAWAKKTGDDALDAALKKAEDEGIVAPQEVHHLMAQAQGRGNLKAGDGTAVGDAMAATNNALSRLTLAWGKPFATAELFNRRVTFVAAYRTAVEQKMGNPYAFAERAIRETQFIYNKGNRPQWARGAFGATLFTFKTYSISYLELLERMWNAGEPGSEERAAGRRAVFFAMGMLLLLGGGGGLPFMEDVEDVVDGVAQRMGYNFSLQQKRREFFQEAFGKAFGGFLEKGVSGLPGAPIDVAGRLGLGNVVPGTGLLQKKDSYTSDVTEMIGPAGDLFTRVAKSANMAGEGRIIDAGLEVSPTAARNVAKSIDMAATGIYKDTRGYKVLDVDAYDALAKAIGFQPGAVATVQEGDRAAQLMVQRTRARESEIAAKWAKGFADNDDALKAEARAELQRWNEKNPETPIRIRIQDVLKRAQKMRQSRAERIASSAPREVREEARRLMGER